ncbi:MAG: C-GCAxxG-C-C family protein [Bacteroidales bacterium]|jgi:C_GCAxxG_C_C family probable redox protein|nr:C-GCAxxG-C-C family protein [Bacteroidales bacterium]
MKEETKELAELAYKLAYDYDLEYGFCPQCVLAAIQDIKDDIPDDLIKSSQTLSGGGGLMGIGSCGALQGGLLAIGFYHGRQRKDFGRKRNILALELSSQLIKKFKEVYGDNISCFGIQKMMSGRSFNNWDPEDAKAFRESVCKKGCAELSGNVAKWTIELLEK